MWAKRYPNKIKNATPWKAKRAPDSASSCENSGQLGDVEISLAVGYIRQFH
jgi:hypothetical protein